MSARALVVYSVDDPNGGTTYPTKDEALRDARERVRLYRVEQNDNATQVSVTKVTIPGPFNRELVCKLLSHGGYASDTETIWTSRRENNGNTSGDDRPLRLK